jgi:hypothetical protein
LSPAWVELQARTKREAAKQQTSHVMDDTAALSTRPDYPPSPEKFDRDVVNRQLANADDSENEAVTKRKNVVCYAEITRHYLNADCDHF